MVSGKITFPDPEPEFRIRSAVPGDAAALLGIYTPYVLNTAITFELTVPSENEFRGRIEHTLEKYPYLVAERDGVLCGYAYCGEFKGRAAYAHSAEVSIYVGMDFHRNGIGRMLYTSLETRAKQQGLLNLNACIAYTEPDDPYLTQGSVRFHEKLGYRQCAHFHQCARKFDRWYDMIWMEKMIGDHS